MGGIMDRLACVAHLLFALAHILSALGAQRVAIPIMLAVAVVLLLSLIIAE
jgi:hypothetical protein